MLITFGKFSNEAGTKDNESFFKANTDDKIVFNTPDLFAKLKESH